MTEFYWITRLGALETACETIAGLSGLALIVSVLFATVFTIDNEPEIHKPAKRLTWVFGIMFSIAIIGVFFIPNKRDLMLIYGVGGTIEYAKKNPTVQQLPDKVVKALDAWLDEKNR